MLQNNHRAQSEHWLVSASGWQPWQNHCRRPGLPERPCSFQTARGRKTLLQAPLWHIRPHSISVYRTRWSAGTCYRMYRLALCDPLLVLRGSQHAFPFYFHGRQFRLHLFIWHFLHAFGRTKLPQISISQKFNNYCVKQCDWKFRLPADDHLLAAARLWPFFQRVQANPKRIEKNSKTPEHIRVKVFRHFSRLYCTRVGS